MSGAAKRNQEAWGKKSKWGPNLIDMYLLMVIQVHSVRSTLSKQSMLIVGGLGASPQKFILEEMQSSDILSEF